MTTEERIAYLRLVGEYLDLQIRDGWEQLAELLRQRELLRAEVERLSAPPPQPQEVA